jgi:hypothetical protein
MGSRRCFIGVTWSIDNCEIVFSIDGERICRTREDFWSKFIVEKISFSCCAGERKISNEERISRYGVMVSGAEIFNWVVK